MTERITEAAKADVLGLQLGVHVAELERAVARLARLAEQLGTGDMNAADHAEEQIGWATDTLRGSVRSLEYLKRYTVTGSRRRTDPLKRTDTQVVDQIVEVMSGQEWSADTLDSIRDVLTMHGGRTIEEPTEENDERLSIDLDADRIDTA